jgi:ParB family chromosome partitioning protein
VANDEQMLEMALVENLHREDLNPLEIAISFQRLLDECNLKQEELSTKVGKDRTTISNYVRLLTLPTEIQLAIRDNKISMGHARALITVSDTKVQLLILHRILEKKLSVRQVEEIVRTFVSGSPPLKKHEKPLLPVKFEKAREILISKLGANVDLKINTKGNGVIIIPFSSDEDFDRILSELEA